MTIHTRHDWSAHLRSIAALADPVDGKSLHLGPLEEDVRGALELPPADHLPFRAGTAPGTGRIAGEELAFWRTLARGGELPDAVTRTDRPTLLAADAFDAIEVFVDAELSALHALWHLARRHAGSRAEQRLTDVRNWHLEHTQPDNATNRPWALHVFIEARTPESMLYAETLLHNAIALEGKPTPLGGALLRDAARAIDAMSW